MPESEPSVIAAATFRRIASDYRRRWRIDLYAVDPAGRVVQGRPKCKACDEAECIAARKHVLAEVLRWGEPAVVFCPAKRLIWAVPLMHNARVLGGLIASTSERRVFPDRSGAPALDIREACRDLRERAEAENVTNAALLAQRHGEYAREKQWAETLHTLKLLPPASIREMYIREEPALLMAIRKDDRAEAREILNRILAAIYYRAEGRLDRTKSFLMELVVTMSRTAVEAGGNVDELFGSNYTRLQDLAQINSQEQLTRWLRESLECTMDAIRRHPRQPHAMLADSALRYITRHYAEPISRDDVAAAVFVSPSHFSRLVKRQLGRSFSDLLNQVRVNQACEQLARTDKSLFQIARETGFGDQSYFTKVFRRYAQCTPRQYRLRHIRG